MLLIIIFIVAKHESVIIEKLTRIFTFQSKKIKFPYLVFNISSNYLNESRSNAGCSPTASSLLLLACLFQNGTKIK